MRTDPSLVQPQLDFAGDASAPPRTLPEELPPVMPFSEALLPPASASKCPSPRERSQAETDWLVIPNLWGLLVGRPGLLKSPAMEAMLTPLKRLAQEAAKAFGAT